MRRRDFLVGLVLTATTRRAQAEQPGKAYRIAVVHPSLPVASLNETGGGPYWQDFFTKLRRLGYVEGQNLVVDRYSAEGRADRYAELAGQVVRSNPDLITTLTIDLVRHLKEVTT